MQKPDFDALRDTAYDSETGKMKDIENMNRLWRALFSIDTWLFLAEPLSEENRRISPFLWDITGEGREGWYLVFTDSDRLNAYGRAEGFADAHDHVYYVSMQTKDAYDWLIKQRNRPYGIRVNEGRYGWFAPLANLEPIYRHLFG